MLWKDPSSKILASFILSFILSVIAYNTIPATAQQDSSNFLTYTNIDLGFTMKYPSDWTVDDTNVTNDQTVKFTSADRAGHLLVMIGNATQTQIVVTNMNNESEKANAIRESLSSNENLLELDTSRYFLSGHPAVRLVETSSQLDLKAMVYNTILNGKWYKVTYFVSPPEDFLRYMQAAQSMIDSFQIIRKD
jgi:PsbP-like protein